MRATWHRDLPFGELLYNRFERARDLDFGEGSSIYESSHVYGDVKVGKNVWVGPFCILDGQGGLIIGDGCNIGAGTKIYTHDTVKRCLSEGKHEKDIDPVEIGPYAYIGPNVVIMRGVAIGHHSVLGAGSFVNKDVPPHSIAVGSPAKVIGAVVSNKDSIELKYF